MQGFTTTFNIFIEKIILMQHKKEWVSKIFISNWLKKIRWMQTKYTWIVSSSTRLKLENFSMHDITLMLIIQPAANI